MKKLLAPRILLLVVLGVLISLPIIINAAPKNFPFHKRCINRQDILKLKNDLNLTDEQKQAIEKLKSDTRAALEPLKEQAAGLRYQMAETFLAEQIDAATAEAQIQQMLQLTGQIKDIMLHAKLQGAQLLDPAQRKLLLDKITEVLDCRKGQQTASDIFPDVQ